MRISSSIFLASSGFIFSFSNFALMLSISRNVARFSLTLLDMEAATQWHLQQKEKVTTFQPKQPAIPNDNRCPAGDTACTDRVPTPPGFTESFSDSSGFSASSVSAEWIAVLTVVGVAFLFACRVS